MVSSLRLVDFNMDIYIADEVLMKKMMPMQNSSLSAHSDGFKNTFRWAAKFNKKFK